MTRLDPSWPPIGSKVAVRTAAGLVKARVQAYLLPVIGEAPTMTAVRLVFDDRALNTEDITHVCDVPHRKMYIQSFLACVVAP